VVRVQVAQVTKMVLMNIISGVPYTISTNIPSSAVLVDVWVERDRPHIVKLLLEDPSFEEIPEGGIPPVFTIDFTATDYRGVAQQLIDGMGWRG
jgi:hypothetical protein